MWISMGIVFLSLLAGLYLMNDYTWLALGYAVIGVVAMVTEAFFPQRWKDVLFGGGDEDR